MRTLRLCFTDTGPQENAGKLQFERSCVAPLPLKLEEKNPLSKKAILGSTKMSGFKTNPDKQHAIKCTLE